MLVSTWNRAKKICEPLHYCQKFSIQGCLISSLDTSQWPQRLTPAQIARLQAPGEVRLLTDAIISFCETEELSFQVEKEETNTFHPRTGRMIYTDVRLIDASSFAALLSKHGETPSDHIQAWFDARCTAPAQIPAPVEPVQQRRTRYLDLFEKEEKRGKRGALQRVADSEGVDRSNLKKNIDKARAARDTEKRAGIWTSQLVQNGKR